MTAVESYSDGSPFDAGRIPCPQGGEDRWSARWLMQQMGYTTWQYFEPVIERAKQAAVNEGFNAKTLFMVKHEMGPRDPLPRRRVRVHRPGCRLLDARPRLASTWLAAGRELHADHGHRRVRVARHQQGLRQSVDGEEARRPPRILRRDSGCRAVVAYHLAGIGGRLMSRVFSSRPQSWPKVFRPNSFPVHSKPKGQK